MSASIQASREAVQRHLAAGDLRGAREASQTLLERAPDDAEALVVHASVLMAAGELPAVVALLAKPVAAGGAPFGILGRYAVCQAVLGNARDAIPVFREALALKPDEFALRLGLAEALDACGEADAALPHYFRAVREAQRQGLWLSDASTPPAMRDRVKAAMRRIDTGRHALFERALAPHVAAAGRDSMQRVAEALELYLGVREVVSSDERQRPKFFRMPALPPVTIFERSLFPWYDALEARTTEIRAELQARLEEARGLEPFLGTLDKAQETEYLAGDDSSRAWDAYFFFRHGNRFDAHHAACPVTSAALDAVPLTRIRDHAPEVLFSVLAPQSHITPHYGVTNTRVVTHLPLVIPEGDCALVVGGDTHRWQEGRCVTFDDTFLHEAWNRTGQRRAVMILDTWNPYLEEAERLALKDLVEVIGDFNAAAGLDG